MKDSTKKRLTITGGLVICAILVFVIAQQFTKEKATDALPPTSSSQQDEVVVDPDSSNPTTDPDASSDISEDDLTINPQTSPNDTGTNAGNGAISSGTEQTIQADPEVPEKPDEETLTDPSQNLTALRSREPLLLRTTTTTSRPSSRPPILGVGCPVSRMSPTPVGTRAEQSTAMAISTNRSAQWADPINMAKSTASAVLFYCLKGGKMKRIISVLLSFAIMLTALCVPAFAEGGTGGSGNIDGGGGSMGNATSHGSWNPGNEGVRITVVRASDHAVVTTPFDLTNKQPAAGIYHFGKVSKIQYNGGAALSPVQGGYSYKNPAQPIPRIISTNGNNNIEAIKRYFCSEYAVKLIAEQTGMDYETLIGGEYKILLEPIAYYKYEGVMIATTATEAAMYDEVVSGHLRTWMGSLTHKNLPLSMFLETADLGYPAWSGSTTQHATNSAIKSSLGLGIVRFEEQPEEPTITTYDYEYRTNTEVITAVEVSGGQSDPDNPVTVRFNILGTTYTVSNVYYPDGDSQLAWVRWTTPDTPQDVTITVSVSGPGSAQGTIQCKIVDLDENPPPNPVADDRNDSFSPSAVPSRAEKTSAQWSIWRPWWYAYWVWHSTGKDSGYWCDHGWWEFDLDRYSASLSASMTITPDTMNPTASGTTMKSGYGINEVVTARVSSSQRSATTALQNAVSYFPEFNYDSFWRLLDRVSISSSSSRLEFQTNEYSTYNRRTHFTPIWYPDGAYTVNTWVIDCWTPVGMLSVNLSDTLTISGNLWDDWHIAPMR